MEQTTCNRRAVLNGFSLLLYSVLDQIILRTYGSAPKIPLLLGLVRT